FLTVVVSVGGSHPGLLAEVLLSLAAQTSQDFDVVVCCPDTAHEALVDARAAIADMPEELRARVELAEVAGGGRGRLFNEGFQRGRGRYLAVLEEDDVAFAHWVETFAAAAGADSGRLVRTLSATQTVQPGHGDPADSYEPVDRPRCPWPSRYSMTEHLYQNRTPICAWAFPRSCVEDLGLRFDETMDAGEGWLFAVQAALLCGVTDAPEVTSLRRAWTPESGPPEDASPAEWHAAHGRVHADLRAGAWPVDGSTIAELIGLQAEVEMLREEQAAAIQEGHRSHGALDDVLRSLDEARHEVGVLRASSSWRVTAPVRWMADRLQSTRHAP
nr:glycosyltransferase family 2 protein [Actinomycetota bacterium]